MADQIPRVVLERELERTRQELEETADKLSNCWLFIDQLARGERYPTDAQLTAAAQQILRGCKAPGWKD